MRSAHASVIGCGLAVVCLAHCADVLDIQPLSGSDAAPDAPDTSDAGKAPNCNITWVEQTGGAVPAGAVANPVPGSTAKLYVCRVASPTLGLIPGKLLTGYACYYGDGQSELIAQSYGVLVPESCSLAWARAPGGAPPSDAIACGADVDGGLLYSCRVGTSESSPGELGHVGQSTRQKCIYSLGGQSFTATDFDILTAR